MTDQHHLQDDASEAERPAASPPDDRNAAVSGEQSRDAAEAQAETEAETSES